MMRPGGVRRAGTLVIVILSACGEPTVVTRDADLPNAPAADVRAQGSPPTWTTTVLGALPGYTYSQANDISDNGIVVGQSQENGFPYLPFYWTQSAGMQPLALPVSAINGEAKAISDNGAFVTGWVRFGDGRQLPARWSWSRSGASLVTLIGCHSGQGYSTGAGVNNAGTVVGASSNVAWSWPLGSSCGSPIVIGTTTMTQANGINDVGTIVGAGWSPSRGFVKTVSFAAQLQPGPGDSHSWAHAVDDANRVVGRSNNGGSAAPVFWNPVAGPPALVLAPHSYAHVVVATSDKGRIVWTTNTGGVSRLGTTTWALNIYPSGVNACGDIVGTKNAVAVLMKKLVCD